MIIEIRALRDALQRKMRVHYETKSMLCVYITHIHTRKMFHFTCNRQELSQVKTRNFFFTRAKGRRDPSPPSRQKKKRIFPPSRSSLPSPYSSASAIYRLSRYRCNIRTLTTLYIYNGVVVALSASRYRPDVFGGSHPARAHGETSSRHVLRLSALVALVSILIYTYSALHDARTTCFFADAERAIFS